MTKGATKTPTFEEIANNEQIPVETKETETYSPQEAMSKSMTGAQITRPKGAASLIEKYHQRLLAPFVEADIEVRPGATKDNKSVPLFYVSASALTRRLDQVLGFNGYSVMIDSTDMVKDTVTVSEYDRDLKKKVVTGTKEGILATCVCTILVYHAQSGLSKTVSNVGERGIDAQSENKMTTAFAQAFKRTCAQLGVGAYIYHLTMEDQPVNYGKFTSKVVPPSDSVVKALETVGFKFKCEETGNKITWQEAAYSMHFHSRVLCGDEIKKLA